jgi:type II secretory pathway predicted ATPase ExeA
MDPTYLAFYRFFGLQENPFNVNPDPEYLFLNQRTQDMLGDLIGAIQARKGLMVISGDVGTGKTTLLNYLIQWLQRQKTSTAFIFNPGLQVRELFDLMLSGFAIPPAFGGSASSLLRLNQWLLERYRAGGNAVLIIDEAQGLPPHVVEEIRMLLNQETPHEKLLQIVLCGQPELEANLNRPDMRQIRQRISLRCKMMPLHPNETHAYVQKRLGTAGATDGRIFTPEAVASVHMYSRGIPRVMNLLCEHALMRASIEQIRPVGAYLIDEVARQLQLDDAKPAGLPLVSLIGEETREASPTEMEIQGPCVASGQPPMSALASLEEPAMAEEVLAQASSISFGNEAMPESTVKRGLRVVRSSNHNGQNGGASSKLVEMPPDRAWKSERKDSGTRKGSSAAAFAAAELRAEVFANLAYWKTSVLRMMEESLEHIKPVRREISQWMGNASEFLLASGWERYAESLLRWLQEPMSTVKVHRRIR